ncbi:MAG: hypothetical protein C3F17_05680 [Bradyrhizobiaceae bacterium]|nr:MAG: hypothetical protein C3F17_05680 [Bradyrhizobiaceae bacterium]
MTVVFAFDTLGYAQRLRAAGVAQEQAEAHAEAARDFIMAELVTKSDLAATRDYLEQAIAATRSGLAAQIEQAIAATKSGLAGAHAHLEQSIAATKSDLAGAHAHLEQSIAATKSDLAATRAHLEQAIGAAKSDLDATRVQLEQTIATTRSRLEQAMDTQTLRLTVRMGALMAAGIAVLGALLKLS